MLAGLRGIWILVPVRVPDFAVAIVNGVATVGALAFEDAHRHLDGVNEASPVVLLVTVKVNGNQALARRGANGRVQFKGRHGETPSPRELDQFLRVKTTSTHGVIQVGEDNLTSIVADLINELLGRHLKYHRQ